MLIPLYSKAIPQDGLRMVSEGESTLAYFLKAP